MPLFKKKSGRDHSGRLQELEAHVRRVRELSAEEARAPGTLQSFLMEDGHAGWEAPDPSLAATPAQEAVRQPASEIVSTPERAEPSVSQSEDEAMLEAALQRYLARMAGEDVEDGPAEGSLETAGDFDDGEPVSDSSPHAPNY
jgi:hypothetical protein